MEANFKTHIRFPLIKREVKNETLFLALRKDKEENSFSSFNKILQAEIHQNELSE